MIHLLPNMRLLALPSDSLGKDWYDQARFLDKEISDLGQELAEEVTYLLFSNPPQELLEGRGECLVARPVIGQKKEVVSPLLLIDFPAQEVWTKGIKGTSLEEIFQEASVAHLQAIKELKTVARPFMMAVRRRLVPELIVECEVMFNE